MAEAGTSSGFGAALRRARAAEAAHRDAVSALSDAKSLRLTILKEEVKPLIASTPEARHAFELTLTAGDTPRLWIDLTTSVIMEPDAKTYRLMQQGHGGNDIVLETKDRAEMMAQIERTMAHQIIGRRARGLGSRTGDSRGYSAAALATAGLSGFALGALALFILLSL